MKLNGSNIRPHICNGYLQINRQWANQDQVELILPMPIERVRANPLVRDTIGKVALQRGPMVYCLAEMDNGSNLEAIYLPTDSELSVEMDSHMAVPVIKGAAQRLEEFDSELYSTNSPAVKPVTIKTIPYFAWNNRKPGEMLVWINENPVIS